MDNKPSLLAKKTYFNKEERKYPVIPKKPVKFLYQSTPNIIAKTQTECFPVSIKNTQDVTLISFRSSRGENEGNEDLLESSRCLSKSESDDPETTGFRGVLRRSFERKSSKNKRSAYFCNNVKIDETSVTSSENNYSSSSKPSLAVNCRPKTLQKSDISHKTLRETFDEFKSLMNINEPIQVNGMSFDKVKENNKKFKKISEIPHIVQLKMDKQINCDLVSAGATTFSKNPIFFENVRESTMELERSLEKEAKFPKSPLSGDEGGYASEDGLSDDGDVILNEDDEEELEFSRPSGEVMMQSIPIVPSQQHQVNERKGYLFKFTTGHSRLTSKLVTSWQKRWVTINSDYLIYFSSPKSAFSRRVLSVCNMLNVKQTIKPADQHPYQFRIIMKHKSAISFASDNSDDMLLWTSIIMKFIIDSSTKVEVFKPGGVFHCPDMQGFAKLEGARGRKFLACKKDKFAVYHTQSDFHSFSPIFILQLQLLSVREVNKLKLQFNTPQSNHIFIFDTPEEMNAWKQVIESGISLSLGDDEVMHKVFEVQSNKLCADCGAAGPEWASINFGITLCQNCAGVHRNMSNAKIKSLRMDFKVWSKQLIEMMKVIGNENANKIWEHSMRPENKINTSSEQIRRKQFIEDKYLNKKFFNFTQGDQEFTNQLLRQGLMSSDILLVLRAVFSGADIMKIMHEIDENSPLSETPTPILELLRQNIGGDRT